MTSNPSHLKVSPQSPAYSEARDSALFMNFNWEFDHVSQLCHQTFANNKIVAAFTRTQ
jgi:hypothetical protein